MCVSARECVCVRVSACVRVCRAHVSVCHCGPQSRSEAGTRAQAALQDSLASLQDTRRRLAEKEKEVAEKKVCARVRGPPRPAARGRTGIDPAWRGCGT